MPLALMRFSLTSGAAEPRKREEQREREREREKDTAENDIAYFIYLMSKITLPKSFIYTQISYASKIN